MLKPFCLQVESTNACNLNCIMCPRQAMTRPIGMMKLNLFHKIIDEIAPLDHVWLHHFGEPLLHPKLVDMINYAKDADIRQVGISTNGLLLTKKFSSEIIEAGLDFMIISVDGVGKTYEKIRVGGKWNRLVRNIRNFLEIKSLGKPETWIQIIDMPQVDVQKAINFWKTFNYIDKIDIKKYDTWGRQVDVISQIKTKQQVNPRCACPHLWAVMVICWDGTCVPCCRDFDAKMPLGDANEENIIDIFNGDAYRKLRLAHTKGNFNNPLCRDCVEWAEAAGIETKFKP